MVGKSTLGLCHIYHQVALVKWTGILCQLGDKDAVALEVVNHFKGFFHVIILFQRHWDVIIVREEFWLIILNTTYDFSVWSDQFCHSLWIFYLIHTA